MCLSKSVKTFSKHLFMHNLIITSYFNFDDWVILIQYYLHFQINLKGSFSLIYNKCFFYIKESLLNFAKVDFIIVGWYHNGSNDIFCLELFHICSYFSYCSLNLFKFVLRYTLEEKLSEQLPKRVTA